MFNIKVLDEAVTSLSDAGKEEIKKMIDIFEEFKAEVEVLREQADAFEKICESLQKENDELKSKLKEQTPQS